MKGKRVMVVAAHPDDADFYCGGTVALWAEQGAEITYVICTDGALGAEEGGVSPEELINIRKKEQGAANGVLGVKETIYLEYRDMSLPRGEELREKIAREYKRHRPEILLTFDPWLRYELHPDHTNAGIEALYARLAAKMPLQYTHHSKEGLKSWSISEAYLFKTDRPNKWIEMEKMIDRKLAALACHQSQFGAMVANQEVGKQILLDMSQKHPDTGRVSEGFRFLPLEGLEGLKTYICLNPDTK